MEKEFVPYTEALALKELGFDEPCFAYYLNRKLNIFYSTSVNDRINSKTKDTFSSDVIVTPTFSQAFKFFREKYGLYHKIDFEISRGYTYNEAYFFIIKEIKGSTSVKIHDNSFNSKKHTPEEWNKKCKSSYEEAELECLKKLIEIVKSK